MAMKDILYITKYTNKEGEEKSVWSQIGTCFGENKDGSMNLKFNVPVILGPNSEVQMRERKEKGSGGSGQGASQESGW